jgi:hypothetical protein
MNFMKSLGVAALLVTLGLTAACPQTGQFLTPNGGFSAEAPKTTEEGGAKNDEIPSPVPESPTVPPDAPPPPSDTPFGGSPPPDAGPDLPVTAPPPSEKSASGSGGQPQEQFLASGKPIEPKSDDYMVDDLIWTFAAARFRYDKAKNFQTILSPAVTPKLTLPQNGAIHFPAFAEVTEKGEGITPWIDSKNYQIRMIYRPEADPSKPVYCDAQVFVDYSAAEGGNVLFSDVTAGKGLLSFYHVRPIADLMQQASFYSDLASPCSLSGWKPLLKGAFLTDEWIHLGSFRTEPIAPPLYRPYQGPVKANPNPVFILP